MSVSEPQRVLHTLKHEGVSMNCTVPPYLPFSSSELSPETTRLVAAFAWIPQPTAVISLITVNKIEFVTRNQCYLRKRKWLFNIIWTNSGLWRAQLCYMDTKLSETYPLYDRHDIRDERITFTLALNLTRPKVLRCLLKNCQHGLKPNGNSMYHQV